MFKSCLRQAATRPTSSSLPTRSTAPSIASFNTRAHQRRHSSSSKPPVPPNNGSPTIPTDVKQVATRSDAKSEGKKPASDRLSRKKAAAAKAEALEAQDNWTSSLPSVPSLHHLNPKDVGLSKFYATHRPISISGPGPRESQIKDIGKLFQPKPAKSKGKGPSEVIYTLSSALGSLNDHIEGLQNSPQADGGSQNELLRMVDANGKHFGVKIVSAKELQNPYKPFQPPPVPVALTAEQLEQLESQAANSESAGEELLAEQLENQIESQDVESAVARGRRDRRKLDALLTPQPHTQTAEIVLTTSELRDRLGYFNSSEPVVVQEPNQSTQLGRRRRGFAAFSKRRQVVFHLISVKRQRKLKMKKHKYKKLMRKNRTLRRKQDKL